MTHPTTHHLITTSHPKLTQRCDTSFQTKKRRFDKDATSDLNLKTNKMDKMDKMQG